ncbi:MAG: hypothetical protein JWQ09_1786 [Segetibacter sp.]|nr:hypothetical protein [Segetibacter sp.]
MNWQNELKMLKYKHMEQRTPGAFAASGGRTMKLKAYNDTTANGLTNCIIDWINYSCGHATRINTQGQDRKEKNELAFGNKREIVRFTPSTTAKGTADIKATIKGRSVNIEVKIGRDKLTEAQCKQRDREEAAGGLYFVARDMISFVNWFKINFDQQKILQHAK